MSISIALCTYNGAKYIKEQLESIVNQTMPVTEIVICDDGSTDNTIELLQQFKQTTNIPIEIKINKNKLGVVKNFAKAISLCKSGFIALADQDDVWLRDKLQFSYNYLNNPKAKNINLVFTDLKMVDEDLKDLYRMMWEGRGFSKKRQKVWRNGKAFYDNISNGNVVTGSTILMRREFAMNTIKYLNDYKGTRLHDELIAYLAMKKNSIGFINRPTVLYRQHARQVTTNTLRPVEISPANKRGMTTNELAAQKFYDACNSVRKDMVDLKVLDFQDKQLRYINDYIQHLEFRIGIKNGRIKNLPKIIMDLFKKRYHNYSNGFHSFFKDIVSPH